MELTTMDERFDAEQKGTPDPELVIRVPVDACEDLSRKRRMSTAEAWLHSRWWTHRIPPSILESWRVPKSPAACIDAIIRFRTYILAHVIA